MFRLKFLLFLLLSWCLFFPNKILAQNKFNGFSISPPFQEIIIDKDNSEKKIEIEVFNKTEKQETFKISAVDFGSLDDSGGLAFLTMNSDNNEKKYSLASWIILEKDSVVLDSNTSFKLKVIISNKESLSPGGHYGAVLVTLDSEKDSNQKNIGVNQAYASLLFVKKVGGEKYELNFKNVDLKNNWFKLPEQVKLRFQNSGNMHVIPRGIVELRDSFGRIVKKGIINQESSIVLPESFRVLNVDLKNQKNMFLSIKMKTKEIRFYSKL